jgi:hypothetical protein
MRILTCDDGDRHFTWGIDCYAHSTIRTLSIRGVTGEEVERAYFTRLGTRIWARRRSRRSRKRRESGWQQSEFDT